MDRRGKFTNKHPEHMEHKIEDRELKVELKNELSIKQLPASYNTPLSKMAEEEMSCFETNYPW